MRHQTRTAALCRIWVECHNFQCHSRPAFGCTAVMAKVAVRKSSSRGTFKWASARSIPEGRQGRLKAWPCPQGQWAGPRQLGHQLLGSCTRLRPALQKVQVSGCTYSPATSTPMVQLDETTLPSHHWIQLSMTAEGIAGESSMVQGQSMAAVTICGKRLDSAEEQAFAMIAAMTRSGK